MLPLLCVSFQGMLKNPHTSRKEKETKLPVLWSNLVTLFIQAPISTSSELN